MNNKQSRNLVLGMMMTALSHSNRGKSTKHVRMIGGKAYKRRPKKSR